MTKSLILFFAAAFLLSCEKEVPRFELLNPSETGVSFNNEIIEKDSFNIIQNEYMYNGGGVGIADFNNDGLQDIVFVGNKVLSRIFLNMGDMTFEDITERFDGMSNEQWLSGVTVVDINSDGWSDLYFTSTMSKDSLNRKNKLWINQGVSQDGLPSFVEMAEHFGIADMGHSVHAAFFDYDLDQDLDLYILNNIVTNEVPTNYRPKITDGSAINNDRLYENLGNGRFSDVTKEAGILYEGFGLGLAIADINKDGYSDIYVSNDYISNDLLYINQRDGTFKNESAQYLSYHSRFSMGNDVADVNNDGNVDIFTVDMMPEQYWRKKQTINGNSYFVYINNEKYNYEPQYVRNMLHIHNGFVNGEMVPFSEVGQMAGVYQTEWSWAPLFADFDNDGDKDLFITNGFPKDLTDKDFTNYKAQVYGSLATAEDILPRIPIVKVPNYAYENIGMYSFRDETKKWGLDIPSYSNGAAFADLDNDGDLDYVVNNINDEAFVYRNNTIGKLNDGPNYIRVGLEGPAPNTMSVGAKVELWHSGSYQYYEHFLTRGYISSVDPVIHFGLSKAPVVDSIKVVWPGGKDVTVLKRVKANQYIKISRSDSTLVSSDANVDGQHSTLFEKRLGLIDYLHQQEDYVDFFSNQRILQHKLSQIGPCIAQGDINNDGKNDLVVGATDKSPTVVFLYNGSHFVKTNVSGLTDSKNCAESDLLIVDVDNDGDNDIISVAGGYANDKTEEYEHCLYENRNNGFIRKMLPLPAFPASVVRAADFDHDGDVDFFIGARVKKGAFPYASDSYLLLNEQGEFHRKATYDLGMVTDAVWSDYDGDGWKDLVITREWNSIAILRNHNGSTLEKQPNDSLDKNHGFWSAIIAADLDEDGDDDYILGNLGENHRFNVNDELPMRLYAIDVDRNESIDPVTTAYWKDPRGEYREYPVNYLDELVAQSPFFRKKFTSYTEFSYASIDSIFDTGQVLADQQFYVNTTSSYILWNGETLNWQRLPSEIQTAPVKEILVKDFNQDSHLDILLAGNDYSYDVSTGYYDASKGTMLGGKGNKRFEIIPPSETGLTLDGQVSSLEYFEGDNPLLVTGINRDSIQVYLHRKSVK